MGEGGVREGGSGPALAKTNDAVQEETHGVSSIIFRATRPFHPSRLRKILSGFAAVDLSKWGGKEWKGDLANESADAVDAAAFRGVIRSKGQIWLANAHAVAFEWHSAGRTFSMNAAESPFLARIIETAIGVECLKDSKLSNGKIMRTASSLWQLNGGYESTECQRIKNLMNNDELWTKEYGDRYQELVLIGVALEKDAMMNSLNAALLNDEEMALGPAGWKKMEDAFFGGQIAEWFWDVNIGQAEPEGVAPS